MSSFMMLFRHTPNPNYVPSQEDIQATIQKWQDWIGSIAAQGKFQSTNQLNHNGRVMSADHTVTDGPYTEIKEILGGYLIVTAVDHDQVLEMAKGCPIFARGGNVEVREIMELNL